MDGYIADPHDEEDVGESFEGRNGTAAGSVSTVSTTLFLLPPAHPLQFFVPRIRLTPAYPAHQVRMAMPRTVNITSTATARQKIKKRLLSVPPRSNWGVRPGRLMSRLQSVLQYFSEGIIGDGANKVASEELVMPGVEAQVRFTLYGTTCWVLH